MDYLNAYTDSVQHPEAFWLDKAQSLAWFSCPTQAFQTDKHGHAKWFPDGELNTCYLALDNHVENGRGEQTALIYDSPVTQSQLAFTYSALLARVSSFANGLAKLGVNKGDRVVIYMPMVPEAVIAMLACARLGAIHSVVFGGFSSSELALRIDDAKPAVLVTSSCGIETNRIVPYQPMVDEALNIAVHPPKHVVVHQREQHKSQLKPDRDVNWDKCELPNETSDCTPVAANDPLYILYTSGTTGKPKGVVRDNGGHAVALHYSMQSIYNVKPGDVFWAASDVGWVVGHSYIVYAPLIAGCTTVLYEGKPVRTPDAGAFWRVVEQHSVNVLFAAPTAFRAIRKEDANADLIKHYDLSSLHSIFMAGERLDPATYNWTTEQTGKPVIDHWWQTETGWPICANPTGIETLPIKAGSSAMPVPGFNVRVLDSRGQPLEAEQQGAIALKLPLPPGCLLTIWGDHQRYVDGYLSEYPGYYASGDRGFIDHDGYVFIMGRTDDVINVAGHRLSTGEMEAVLAAHDAIAECSVIGVHCGLKGQVPVGLALIKDGVEVEESQLQEELIAMVRKEIGPIACLKRTIIVPRLPKTRSGKILRKLLRQIADGQPVSVPSTIDDPDCVEEITQLMRDKGLVSSL